MVAFEKARKRVYFAVILFGIICIFATPVFAHADIFGFEVQDIYVRITENVKEANDILDKAFEFAQTSPYDVIESIADTAQGRRIISIRSASRTMALVIVSMLLMIDFFRKSINFEWSSKWENVLIFLIKIIVVKQIIQNADNIVGYIYSGFQSINDAAVGVDVDFLPYGTEKEYYLSIKQSVFEQVRKGWWDYWYDKGAGDVYNNYYYTIAPDAVKMFYPTAIFPENTNLGTSAFPEPTETMMFMPTLEIVLLQPYFLVMKAIAYMIFVISIGRVFELSVYTIFAPLPLATFASDTTHDVAKSFIKNYIATVLQIAVIVVMFLVYAAVNKYFLENFFVVAGHVVVLKLIQLVELITLGLGVMRSGTWARRLCGIG